MVATIGYVLYVVGFVFLIWGISGLRSIGRDRGCPSVVIGLCLILVCVLFTWQLAIDFTGTWDFSFWGSFKDLMGRD